MSHAKIFWVVVSNMFYFHPYLGKIPILTDIFQMGWNHQLVSHAKIVHYPIETTIYTRLAISFQP